MTGTAHWNAAYAKGETALSWYAVAPRPALGLIERLGVPTSSRILDAGGGASPLVDGLLDRGFSHVTVVDLSEAALDLARNRLGERADQVRWIVADLREWAPPHPYEVWHDRAVLHFMTSEADRTAYLATLRAGTTEGSLVVLATFAPDGPEQCSGLPVQRYDAEGLTGLLGSDFVLIEESREEHVTPWGSVQPFTRCAFRRV